MNVLITKLGATGDVVRTTTLLRRFTGHVSWITETKNTVLLQGLSDRIRCLSWEERNAARDRSYDLAINLEDTLDVGLFLETLNYDQLFGAYVDSDNVLRYSDDSCEWFDLSLTSRFGREEADKLKYRNRRTYQDLIFSGLGFQFNGETYILPAPAETDLSGDIAIAAEAGPVWPMKNWAYYTQLKSTLEQDGLRVNFLPKRSSLLEHLGDIRNHRCLIGGDSLPMHFALGTGTPCVTLFTCTSPWEIYDYGLQTKIVSPLLGEFFYERGFDPRATTAIGLDEVYQATVNQCRAYRSGRLLRSVAFQDNTLVPGSP
jgi:Glycosyltransferase family 9 (heptosyltransferase)